jgi:shikimate kinase
MVPKKLTKSEGSGPILLCLLRKEQFLVTGPPGVGKSTLCEEFNRSGIEAIDSDSIKGLCRFYHLDGKPMTDSDGMPREPSKEEIDKVSFLPHFKPDVLQQLLVLNPSFRFFADAPNVDQVAHLFEKVFYLRLSPEHMEERLKSPDRKNTGTAFTGGAEQRETLINRVLPDRDMKALKSGWVMLDARLPPQELKRIILEEIRRGRKGQ